MKQKKCRSCKEKFPYYNSTQIACSPKCALELVKQKKSKEYDKETRRLKESIKSKSKWIKEAQSVFNAYIRCRDKGDACISCGKHEAELKINNPISMVCGHYLSVGAHPELRFHPFDGNLQCTRCNGGAGKYGNFNNKEKTVTQSYRVNLIKKIGLEMVEWLEGPHEPQKLSIEDIKEIKQHYKEQLKLIKE